VSLPRTVIDRIDSSRSDGVLDELNLLAGSGGPLDHAPDRG
jgi:hypothetical protein